MPRPSSAPLWLVLSAFGAVYLIWGSTYLGIKLAIDSIPPFLMAGSRFVVAGSLLYAVMRLRGVPAPSAREWKSAAIIGGLLLFMGNGGVTWAEKIVPTGQASLLVAATPLWILLADWLRPGGRFPGKLTLGGLAMGFTGVLLIVLARDAAGLRVVPTLGAFVVVLSTIAWAVGSIYARHAAKPASALLGISMQMITGGLLLAVASLVAGEPARFHPSQITAVSAWAWIYLTFIGSLAGFTAYVWLLAVSTPAKVSTYAYVNPLVAVLLGCVVLKEPFPPAAIPAICLIFTAVLLISRQKGEKPAE